jgi:hypothetical protein
VIHGSDNLIGGAQVLPWAVELERAINAAGSYQTEGDRKLGFSRRVLRGR